MRGSVLFLCLLAGSLMAGEKEVCRRIENHLIIRDTVSAVKEAAEACRSYSTSLSVQEAALKAFSRGGEEKEALLAFAKWKELSPNKPPRRLYEELAWGIIGKEENSSSPMIRTIALLAAFWGQDARGIQVIERRLADQNSLVRQAAAEVASQLPDERLQKAMLARLEVETDWETRLELVRGVGRMKIKETKPRLIEIIGNPKSTMEEKGAATESLLDMLETVPQRELEALAQSDRASLRSLAAEIITVLQQADSASLLWKLIEDPRAEVRAQAALGLGVLREPPRAALYRLMEDREFHVRLAAAYALILARSSLADSWVEESLKTEKPENAALVASMLAAAGSYGKPLARRLLPFATDFYVRMNLALAVMDDESLEILYQGVANHSERWARVRRGIFRPLAKSEELHNPLIPNFPEQVNKETRLEILNLLAVKEHPKALEAVRAFLKEKGWGLSGLGSVLLLTEGDETSAEGVRELLKDPDPDIRLQAALILSRWDPERGDRPDFNGKL